MKNKFKILLVEDNPFNQKIVKFNLNKNNHEVVTAMSGMEAIEIFKKEKFDFILMDIMMPEMDGLETTVKIRSIEKELQMKKETPIIALTANTLDNDREKCINHGMNEYMTKPFKMDKLVEILEFLEIY
ncbi:MAG: response regulator [Chlorobi bacterium]|nr:response regulator [Chlorobiota bacterium]